MSMSLSAVDPSTIEFGQSLPPHGPHTITMHIPKWETALRFIEGDKSIVTQLKSIYPRILPFGLSATVSNLSMLFY
jgi:cystathionine gamma-synthase